MSKDAWHAGRLEARPSLGSRVGTSRAGTTPLGLRARRDGFLHVPASLEPGRPAPLLVMLHGAGGSGANILPTVSDRAERHGVLVVAPDSRGGTWDLIEHDYGPDVEHIDRALAHVFGVHDVDPERIAIGGFSDGASYALSLGLINGELFSDILAFSPGFAAPAEITDSPRIFISHGTEDRVLPIERCSRRLVSTFQRTGFDLDYREFPGGHVVPTEMLDAAFERFLGRQA